MADTTKDWIKVRDRIDEDDAVGRAATAYFEIMEAERDETIGSATTLVVGAAVRLWCLAKNRGRRIPGTDDAEVSMSNAAVSVFVGDADVVQCLRTCGLLWFSDSDTVIFPNLCRWVTLWSEIREQKSIAGARGGRHKPSTSEAQGKHKPSTSEALDKPDSKLQTPDSTVKSCAAAPLGEQAFEAWWRSYPRRDGASIKGNKGAARKAWDKLDPAEWSVVERATAAMVKSGEMPKDAERFLRAPRGGGDPTYLAWLSDAADGPVAAPKRNSKPSAEDGKYEEDLTWLKEMDNGGSA